MKNRRLVRVSLYDADEQDKGKRLGHAYGYMDESETAFDMFYGANAKVHDEHDAGIDDGGELLHLRDNEKQTLQPLEFDQLPKPAKVAWVKHQFRQAGVKGDGDENVE